MFYCLIPFLKVLRSHLWLNKVKHLIAFLLILPNPPRFCIIQELLRVFALWNFCDYGKLQLCECSFFKRFDVFLPTGSWIEASLSNIMYVFYAVVDMVDVAEYSTTLLHLFLLDRGDFCGVECVNTPQLKLGACKSSI